MTFRSTLASGALLAATAAVVLTSAMAIPGVSLAQPYESPEQACQQQQDNRAVTGAILGGIAGAALGNSVSRGNRTGGTVIGGVTGAAVGATVGSATTNCQADYPPPPPPPSYDDNGPPPPPPGYGQNCGWAQRQLIFPDGTQARDSVEACQDQSGRWSVAPQ